MTGARAAAERADGRAVAGPRSTPCPRGTRGRRRRSSGVGAGVDARAAAHRAPAAHVPTHARRCTPGPPRTRSRTRRSSPGSERTSMHVPPQRDRRRAPARARGAPAARAPDAARAAVALVAAGVHAGARAVGEAGRTDAFRTDAGAAATAHDATRAAARRVARQIDAALAAGRARLGTATDAQSRLAEAGARAGLAASTAVQGSLASERQTPSQTTVPAGQPRKSRDAGLTAAAGAAAAAAMVRIGGREHANIAAARLPGCRAATAAVAAGLARSASISAATAIGGIGAKVGTRRAAGREPARAGRWSVGPDIHLRLSIGPDIRLSTVAAGPGADRYRCVLAGSAVCAALQPRPAAADDGHEADPKKRRQAPEHARIFPLKRQRVAPKGAMRRLSALVEGQGAYLVMMQFASTSGDCIASTAGPGSKSVRGQDVQIVKRAVEAESSRRRWSKGWAPGPRAVGRRWCRRQGSSWYGDAGGAVGLQLDLSRTEVEVGRHVEDARDDHDSSMR